MALPELTPGRRDAVDRRGRIHVVAGQHQGPVDLAHRRDGSQGHHRSPMVADLESSDVVFLVAVLGHRLDDHLPGAAEAVEIVDVERAEIDLQGHEHIAQLDPLEHAGGAVDIEIDLRDIRPEDRR